jgi:peptide-methionine (S)-S-oxide reductase
MIRLRKNPAVKPVSACVGLLLICGVLALSLPAAAYRPAPAIPPPAMDEAVTPQSDAEVAVLAGGCFWGIQGVYQHTKGVLRAVSGYAGGDKGTANYTTVSFGTTGHAESVRVTFDPKIISYGRILQIYFSVAHDPTQLNRQDPDEGPQYRSAIFPVTAEQTNIARAYIAQLDQTHVYKSPVVTKIEPDKAFYPAEDYHQDYLTLNPTSPYIALFDMPKIKDLNRLFPDYYRAEPVLVAGTVRTQ